MSLLKAILYVIRYRNKTIQTSNYLFYERYKVFDNQSEYKCYNRAVFDIYENKLVYKLLRFFRII